MGRRRWFAVVALALAVGATFGASGRAASTTLWPGVTFEQTVEFTSGGPVALNVLIGPRPDEASATTLVPVLSNETVEGRETLTSMQRRLASTATTAGVNADFFALATGRPSGVFMRAGDLAVGPNPRRSSAGVLTDGTLQVRRIAWRGTWVTTGGQPHPLTRLNDRPAPGGAALLTAAYGTRTPSVAAGLAAVLFPFPPVTPGADLPATVVELVPADTPVAIPPGGAVLLTVGASAAALQADASVGEGVVVRVDLAPAWDALLSAIGGGPELVRNGAPILRPAEAFSSSQLAPRAPRSGVGQLADGRVVLVTVDGRQPGYSVGLSNTQLAAALARLGAVTAMAFDSGGSATMAFDGALLNRPSGGRERPIASALMLTYTGVYVPEPTPVVSPNGDGVDDTQSLGYRLVRPSLTTVSLTGPGGVTAPTDAGQRDPGAYPVAFPQDAAEGRWTLAVTATDDVGRETSMTREFAVNGTLGFLSVAPRTLRLPPGGASARIGWRLRHTARVTVTITTQSGVLVRTVSRRTLRPGEHTVSWNGLAAGRPVRTGRYVVRVAATNALGTVDLHQTLTVRRVAAA